MYFYLFQVNFPQLLIVIYMYIFLYTNRTLNKTKTRDFFLGCLCANILIITDSIDCYLSHYQNIGMFRYFVAACGYTFRPAAVAVFMTAVSDKIKRIERIFMIPLYINGVLAFSSYYTHAVFYFEEPNVLRKGMFGFMPFLISFIYIAVLSWYAMQMYRIGNRRELTVIVLIDVMAIVSTILETALNTYFLINAVCITSIVFYYLFLHSQMYKRDALTHALNRHAFYSDIDDMKCDRCVISSMDLNNLKELNDNIGHDAGDMAIEAVANIFHARINPDSQFYRVGGDEFVLISYHQTLAQVEAGIQRIYEVIKREGYEIAWGCAEYRAGMDINKVIAESDAKMYECKARLKRKWDYLTEPDKEKRGKICIIVDSSCGISRKEAKEMGIKVFSVPIVIDNVYYYEDETLDPNYFWKKMNEKGHIRTIPSTKLDVTSLWDTVLQDYEQILHIPVSSRLSKACENATEYAKEEKYQDKVYVADIGRVSTPYRRSVMDALELIEEGYSAAEIKYILEESRSNMVIYVSVQSMKLLLQGGKINVRSAMLASLLRLKPVLKYDIGTIGAYKNCLTTEKAKQKMLEAMKHDLETTFKPWADRGEVYLLAASSASEEETDAWIAQIKQTFPDMDVMCDRLPLTVCTYIGEGGLGIGCSCKPSVFTGKI